MATGSITTPDYASPRARPRRFGQALDFPVLDRQPGMIGRRLAALPGDGHPVWTYVCGTTLALLAIAALSIVLGVLLSARRPSQSRRRE